MTTDAEALCRNCGQHGEDLTQGFCGQCHTAYLIGAKENYDRVTFKGTDAPPPTRRRGRVAVSGRTENGHPYRAHFQGTPKTKDVEALERVVDGAAAQMVRLNKAEREVVRAAIILVADWKRREAASHPLAEILRVSPESARSPQENALCLAVEAFTKEVKEG